MFNTESDKSFEERRTWIFGGVTALSYLGYLSVVLLRAGQMPLREVAYAWPLVGSILLAIAASIVGTILSAISRPEDADQSDERDASIDARGDRVGYQAFSVLMLGPLALAMAEVDHFWIGNAIYLGFVIAAEAAVFKKIVLYRRGF